MNHVVFPEYLVNELYIETNVRKKHRGKWYLILVKTPTVEPTIHITLQLFIKQVYNVILFGKIAPSAKNMLGQKIFQLDTSQKSEEERLCPIYFKPYNHATTTK